MKTGQMQTGVRLAAFLLAAVFCVLACAGCAVTPSVGTEANGTEAGTTGTGSTVGITTATETESTNGGGEGGAVPLALDEGATVSFSPTGLRVTATVDKAYLDALRADYGENAVKVGILFAPSDAISGNVFDVSGSKTVKVAASVLQTDGDVYRFGCTLTGLTKADYEKPYYAVAYAEANGKITRCSAFSKTANSRTLSVLAEEALLDLNGSKTGKYQYAVKVNGSNKYSPYTESQRDTLNELRYPFSITVMSYNIEVYDSKNGWEGRNPDKALETVKEQSPDIVGFQEVNEKWDTKLAAFAKDAGYTRKEGGYCKYNFEKNEIFYKTDKFDFVAEGTVPFQQAASSLKVPNTEEADWDLDGVVRIFHYVVLTQKETGKKILVVSAHLHYGGTGSGHEEDDKVRRYQIRALLAWLEKQSASFPYQIVMGDMNSHYKGNGQGAVNMQLFTDAGFKRTSDTALVANDVGGTLAGDGRTQRDPWIFDYVLTKDNFEVATYTVVNNPVDNGKYPSDHIPVMARVRCK